MNQHDYAAGIDIGGGSLKYGVVNLAGQIIWPHDGVGRRIHYDNDVHNPAPVSVPEAALAQALQDVTRAFGPVGVVGICATGLVDAAGLVIDGVSFSGYAGHDWSATPRRMGWSRVVVTHDVRAAAWAEHVARGKPVAHLHVTLGTGIALAFLDAGEFYLGVDYAQGELGFSALLNPLSGGMDRRLAAHLDDPKALGCALLTLIHLLNPRCVQLSGFAPRLASEAVEWFYRETFSVYRKTSIEVVGAASEVPVEGLSLARLGRRSLQSGYRHDTQITDLGHALEALQVYAPEPMYVDSAFVFLERYCGGLGIEDVYARLVDRRMAFAELVNRSDALSRRVLTHVGRVLGVGLANAILVFRPQLITLGGAVPAIAPALVEAAREMLDASVAGRGSAIEPGRLQNDAGLIGAALYALAKG